MLDRQLRQVPRWLGQNRYNGPSGGVNKPDLPEADVAKHAEHLGRRAAPSSGTPTAPTSRRPSGSARSTCAPPVLGQRRFSVTPPSRASRKRPRSAYNSVVSADGGDRRVRDRRVDVPAGQARRPDDRARARPRDRRGDARQPRLPARRARRRAPRSTRRSRPTAGSSRSRRPTPAATARRRATACGSWTARPSASGSSPTRRAAPPTCPRSRATARRSPTRRPSSTTTGSRTST